MGLGDRAGQGLPERDDQHRERLMLRAVGYEVKKLVRVRLGSLLLEKMCPGEWRPLTERELATLMKPVEKVSSRAQRSAVVGPHRASGNSRV